MVDEFLRLALQEEIRRRRAGGDSVDGDIAPAKFFREDVGYRLDACLGRRIDRIGRLVQSDDARREVDDAPVAAQAFRGLAQRVERAFEIAFTKRSKVASSVSAIAASTDSCD